MFITSVRSVARIGSGISIVGSVRFGSINQLSVVDFIKIASTVSVRNFASLAVRGEPLQVTGDGSPTRAWIFVDDFVSAVFALASTPSAWGRSYNVGKPDTLVSTRTLA